MYLPSLSEMNIKFLSPLVTDYAVVTYTTPLGVYSLHGGINAPFAHVVSYKPETWVCNAILPIAYSVN